MATRGFQPIPRGGGAADTAFSGIQVVPDRMRGTRYLAGGREFDNYGAAEAFLSQREQGQEKDLLSHQANLQKDLFAHQMNLRGQQLQSLLGGFADFTGMGGGGGGQLGQPGFADSPESPGSPGGSASSGGLSGFFDRGINQIEQSRRAEIGQGVQSALNTSQARLEDRGFGGSSLAQNAAMGAERTEQRLLSDLAGDIGSLRIRGTEAALQARAGEQQRQLQLLTSLLGTIF